MESRRRWRCRQTCSWWRKLRMAAPAACGRHNLRETVHPLVLLLIFASYGLALDVAQPAGRYIQTAFTVEDGLPSNVVNDIVQTRNGFLWIGTDAGLARFDGRHFAPVNFRGPQSTAQGIVRSLA